MNTSSSQRSKELAYQVDHTTLQGLSEPAKRENWGRRALNWPTPYMLLADWSARMDMSSPLSLMKGSETPWYSPAQTRKAQPSLYSRLEG